MKDLFGEALMFTLKWEGGFVNDPRDAGGATNYGVSLRFLRNLPLSETDFDGDGTLTWRDVQGMSLADATGIYQRHFWIPMHCETMSDGLALTMFDGAVNMGTGRATRFLQRAVNSCWKRGALDEDGVFGPATLRAVNYVLRKTAYGETLAFLCLHMRVDHYKKLGASPRYKWAFDGWMNRTRDLWDEVMGGRTWPKDWPQKGDAK